MLKTSVPFQQKESCPAADVSVGGSISKPLHKLALPDVFLFLEHGMGSGLEEFLEPMMFYLQGYGQYLPPLEKSDSCALYPSRLKGAYAVEKVLSVFT